MPHRLATFTAAIATAAAIVGVALVVSNPAPQRIDVEPVAIPTTSPGDGSWAAAAAALPVTEAAASAPAYDRASFGENGADVDGNGCTQRDDVLARDLVDAVRTDCVVAGGTLHDPYTGRTIAYSRDRAAADGSDAGIRIDHVVGLRAAHDGGAWRWSPERRAAFANGLENLLAVDAEADRARSGRGPARWLPADHDLACEYAMRYTWIATAWELAVPRADRDALVTTLSDCRR